VAAIFGRRPNEKSLDFHEQRSMKTIMAGLGGEEVLLGNEAIFAWAFF